jgi:hypothetical protein
LHFSVVDGHAVAGAGGDVGHAGSFWIALHVHTVGWPLHAVGAQMQQVVP